MPFIYARTVRFQDTDAAGVVYFANVLAMCHEAYEASLAETGIDLKQFFGKGAIAVPIVHASVDLRQPMFCGEQYAIFGAASTQQVSTQQVSTQQVSQAATIHIAIETHKRTRAALPENLTQWLQRWQVSSNL
jgi:1,4-dihydroxy-2-naphthoyl-CoA hydrolase